MGIRFGAGHRVAQSHMRAVKRKLVRNSTQPPPQLQPAMACRGPRLPRASPSNACPHPTHPNPHLLPEVGHAARDDPGGGLRKLCQAVVSVNQQLCAQHRGLKHQHQWTEAAGWMAKPQSAVQLPAVPLLCSVQPPTVPGRRQAVELRTWLNNGHQALRLRC